MTDFADTTTRWKVGVEVFQFLVQRKRSLVSDGDHAKQSIPLKTDKVRVLVVESVRQDTCWIRWMLRNFLNEGSVVEAEDLFELPVF